MDVKPGGTISDFYSEKTVVVTGASGSLGKVLLWKLLLSCSDIETIYVLMRPKEGKDAQCRVNELLQTPIFHSFKKDNSQVLNKVKAISGDINEDKLGLSKVDERKLIDSVHIIFHIAALVKFNANFKDAIDTNVGGTQRLLKLATKMSHLQAFVYTSTAYCLCDNSPELGEKVYETKDSPQNVLRLVSSTKPDTFRSIQKDLIKPFPNSYTYSKRLAENLVAGYHSKLPIVITRPTTVGPSMSEPIPGWADDKNDSFIRTMTADGKGVLRVMLSSKHSLVDLIPMDIVCNSLIVVARKIGRSTEKFIKFEELPVYNLGALETEAITQDEIMKKGSRTTYEYPFSLLQWYRLSVILTSNIYVYTILNTVLHWIPAYLADALLFLLGYKRFMVRIQRRIHEGAMAESFFMLREWKFEKNNILQLRDELSETDQNIFKLTCRGLNWEEYFRMGTLVARWHLMKEDPTHVPKAKPRSKIFYVSHYSIKLSFWLFVGYICLDVIPTLCRG